MRYAVVSFVLIAGLAGCTVGPDYRPANTPTPPAYQDVPENLPLSRPQQVDADISQWWRQFDDPELGRLMGQALDSNLDLQSAASRIREAREQEVVAGAAGLPNLNATALGAHLHANSSPLAKLGGGGSAGGGNSASGSQALDLSIYSVGFDATWELDVFGGVRRSVEAAKANSEASVWALRDGEVSLSAELAGDYLTLRATQARIALVQSELQRQQDTLSIVQARAQTGFVTALDVDQQQTQQGTTRAELPPLQAQARAMVHAISILLGRAPEELAGELDAAAPIPAVPATLPIGLPSDLLRRRPDIREAERKLAAATAGVGVAVAQLYPKFNLLALASFAGNSLGNILSTDNFAAAGAGMIAWPVFNGGKTTANIHASEEEQTQAYLAYRKAVLVALRDVEDALARYNAEQQRLVTLRQSVTAANNAFTVALQQYNAGLVPYLNVLSAQMTLLDLQDSTVQSEAAFAEDLVSLYKALGGGWAPDETKESSSASP